MTRVVSKRFTAEAFFYPLGSKPIAKVVNPPKDVGGGKTIQPANWPQFRGPYASGVADGQDPPLTFDVKEGTNVLWKTPIPGLGHSCPVVWGDRVFLTTAVGGDTSILTGNYGNPASVKDESKHTFQVVCLDRASGKILWTRTVFEGVPKIKRHLKGSHANCTPATDGKRVVDLLRLGGDVLPRHGRQPPLEARPRHARLQLRARAGVRVGFRRVADHSRGPGHPPGRSEPRLVHRRVQPRGWFATVDHAAGRDPVVEHADHLAEREASRDRHQRLAVCSRLRPGDGEGVMAAGQEVRGDRADAGGRRSDLAFVTSGNRPIQPVFAIKAGAAGDISLKTGESSNAHVAWGRLRGGPYMPTPIVYGEHLYTIGNSGMVTCYETATGREIYKERLGGTSYTASPVAADGRLYFVSEQGDVRVLKVGPDFELLAVNKIGEVCMATPAISGGVLFVRTKDALFAFGRK